MSLLCIPCDLQFKTLKDLAKHNRETHANTTEVVEQKTVEEPVEKPAWQDVERKPIKLTYVYVGNHKCGANVTTLELDIEKKHFCVAFCPSCHEQVSTREVIKLE